MEQRGLGGEDTNQAELLILLPTAACRRIARVTSLSPGSWLHR